ncbi:uncharacterized protein LOC126707271 [Quercus robur]|uniref:uncharacterized protein LOC126707271 n=1 Tax=Quercus robur TaxID=38942 RepID=UPI0021625DEC|nr:uncharacterized protein LOC126707271 [Quercus robur]
MKDDRCEGVIKDAWVEQHWGNPINRLVTKVEACYTKLKTWNRTSFGHIRSLLEKKRKLLAQAEALLMTRRNHEQLRTLKGEVYELMVKEDAMWHQRLRVEWLKAGDLNTSYFHSRATQRNRRNFISKLNGEDGQVVEDEQKIGEMMASYFSELFTTAAPSDLDPILQGIERKVTPQMIQELTREYTAKEVEVALKQMKSISAPGPDEGLHALIKQAAAIGTISGVSLCREGPKVTHLFFMDDSLLFCKANSHECNSVLELLEKYERASGQRINQDKTQLFFSSNTNQQVRNSIKGRLGVAVSHQFDKYLRLPSFVDRGKKQSFSYIRERIW